MRRLSAAIFAALFTVGVLAPAAFAASSAAAKAVPKVVFIVGPAGVATSGYRAQAMAAAAIARKYTPDVVELYSPDATWPAVKDALAGASLVVYMGHGNGWPSKYRDALYPLTQDGFGLNPTTVGGDDFTHQYFGEASIGAKVRLAKNAVVLLNHLCYASGNSEPGLPEGSLAVAKQRIDNYAAGFIKAGASAVIAEAWSSPSYFVKTVLAGSRSIQSAWTNAPSANGHRSAFASDRSPGYVAEMDTEYATSGFTRSIVMKTGLASKDVLAGASGSAGAGLLIAPARTEPDRDRDQARGRRRSSVCRLPEGRGTSTFRSRSRIARRSRRAWKRASAGIRSTSRSSRPTRLPRSLPSRRRRPRRPRSPTRARLVTRALSGPVRRRRRRPTPSRGSTSRSRRQT